jgi:ABC-type dipeptide/oligopeptide/nickel transport system permease subunit
MPIIVLTHVIIAVASIALSSVTFFKPGMQRLIASYGLIIATVASGTYLLMTTPGNILKSCLVGLFYLTVVSLVTIATHVRIRRLAAEEL